MSYFKRFLIFALSALLIFAQPVAYAASPNGWAVSPADIIMNGATATITAIKGAGSSALQSTVKHAPTAANVSKKILRGGGSAAVAFAMVELADGAIDWVLDPANNRVRYTVPADHGGSWSPDLYKCINDPSGVWHSTAQAACNAMPAAGHTPLAGKRSDGGQFCYSKEYGSGFLLCNISVKSNPELEPEPVEKYIPIDTVAAKVVSNSAAGHAPSQELVKTVIIDDVNTGALDTPLNIAAVPKADAPAVPDPDAPPIDPDAPPVPFDPSSIISAIKSVMAAVVNMSGVLGAKFDALMVEMGLQNAETNRVINDGMADVVAANNATGARVGDVVAAIEAIEGNTLDGQVINDAVDRVIAEGKTNTSDIVAAIEAIEGNTLDGQVINDAVDRVIANDNVNAQAAADAATAAAEAAEAADAANTAAVTDAIEAAEAARAADALEAKEAADAKAAADAAALEWAKEAPEAPTDTGVMVDEPISDFDSDKSYITFTGSCPPKYTASLSIMGATAPFEFDYAPICTVMSYLKPFIVGAGYIAAAYIIAGHSRGSKD